MHSQIRDIVSMINQKLCDLIPGWQLYGIAQTVAKDANVTMPAENETYIGIDDTFPAQVYHKINGIQIVKLSSGYGDSQNLVYNYQMAMIIFLNRNRIDIRPEDLVIMIQGTLPQRMQMKGIVNMNINFNSVNMNDQQVFTQEYKDASIYKIGLNQNLFQINYNLEITYKPSCFEVCPPKDVCKN
jgi:hypothetical protein